MIPGHVCYKKLNPLGNCGKYVEISSELSGNVINFFTVMTVLDIRSMLTDSLMENNS